MGADVIDGGLLITDESGAVHVLSRADGRESRVVQLGSGAVTREMWPLFAIVAPAMAVPSLLGARVHTGLSEQAARRVVLLLLIASGIAMLWASVPALLAR